MQEINGLLAEDLPGFYIRACKMFSQHKAGGTLDGSANSQMGDSNATASLAGSASIVGDGTGLDNSFLAAPNPRGGPPAASARGRGSRGGRTTGRGSRGPRGSTRGTTRGTTRGVTAAPAARGRGLRGSAAPAARGRGALGTGAGGKRAREDDDDVDDEVDDPQEEFPDETGFAPPASKRRG